jgi:hypothetical protein
MKILLLAPESFYQDRGTPIAVNLLLRALSERGEQVDVLTYHEGRDVNFQRLTLHRIVNLSFIRNVRPGFSWKKVICDFFMFLKSARLVRKNHYDLIFAVEESVFIALVWKWIFKLPYVYDMDSSLAQQMVERYPFFTPFTFLFKFCENLAVRNAIGVVPVCETLTAIVRTYKPKKVVVLQDISILTDARGEKEPETSS